MSIFRALWPVTNERLPFTVLIAQARHDLPILLAQAHARPAGAGRWSMAESIYVPGSGRVTTWVLIYECPARHAPLRALQQAPAAVASTPAAAGSTTHHQAGDTAA